MKKKGFTLIELLAVIVILAIIALIITPIISNVIDASRKAAFKESVNGIIDSTNNYVHDYILKNNSDEINYPVTFTCDGTSCKNGDDTLLFKGNAPKSGRVIIGRDGVLAEYITDGKYCAYGYKWNLLVEGNCGEVDSTKPTITGTQSGKVITLTMTDNESGIDSYCATMDTDTTNCNWIVPSNASNETYEIPSAGKWYFYAKDRKANISSSIDFTTSTNDYCKYTINEEAENFTQPGEAIAWTVPTGCAGTYRFEVAGASGSSQGGKSYGNLTLDVGDTLYICVGGTTTTTTGGYNGGGNGWRDASGPDGMRGGGGATHIATTLRGTGILSSYNSYRDEILIVAGGGGGAGKAGNYNNWETSGNNTNSSQLTSSFGQGGNGSSHNSRIHGTGGGGGGYFGGRGGTLEASGWNYGSYGAGGSGYVSPSLDDSSMTTGGNSGDGYVKITLLSLN